MNLNESLINDTITSGNLFPTLIGDQIHNFIDNSSSGGHNPHSYMRTFSHGRDKGFALRQMDILTDKEFTRMYRLNRLAFYFMLTKITPYTSSHGSLRNNLYRHSTDINPKTKLAVTLRWLAGGSYLDICFGYGVAVGTFYISDGILWGTIAAIDLVLSIGFPLNDPAKLEEISNGFSQYTSGRMKGCVMAIDGWVCRTRCPNKLEVINQTSFRNGKGMFGLVVFAGCSYDCKFMMLSTISAGSTNDSLAWKMSKFYHTML